MLFRSDERDGATDYCRDDGRDDEKGIVPDQNGKLEREHADEVHAPDPEPQRQRSAASPDEAAPARGGEGALRNLDGDVRAQRGNEDGKKDEAYAIGFIDHVPTSIAGRKEIPQHISRAVLGLQSGKMQAHHSVLVDPL